MHSNLLAFSAQSARHRLGYLLAGCLLLLGCQPSASERTYTAATTDTAWQTLEVRYAQGFWLTYHEGYKMLYVRSGADTLQYLLLPRGAVPPEDISYDQLIRIPVQRLVTQSTTHLGLVAFAGAEDRVVGVDEADFIYDKSIRQQVRQGAIREVGGGESLNTEKVMALSPDLLMVSGMPQMGLERYQALLDVGIPVLINTEWMEHRPLGEAEWVKVVAALTNQEATVAPRFEEVVHQYDSIAALVPPTLPSPKIITGSPFQGTWFVSGDHSYFSQLLRQAGASWAWAGDTTATTLPLSFETMYAYGLEAEYWLNPGQINSKQDLLAKDPRFADFRAFQNGNIYNNNRRMSPSGAGNDYYESGVVNPHLVLADMIRILHPELLPYHSLFYYQKIE